MELFSSFLSLSLLLTKLVQLIATREIEIELRERETITIKGGNINIFISMSIKIF